jgi:ribosome-associated protein
MADDDRDGPSRRELARKQRRAAGDRSGDLARRLKQVKDATLTKLELHEDLREVIEKARAITSNTARRRAERALAGELRRFDIDEVERQLANVQSTGVAEPQLFHMAERWRARLLDEDAALAAAAVAQFPGGAGDPMPRLIADARRERATGKPPGGARALFRHIIDVLRAQAAGATGASGDD